ncbi:unnamed protein product [Penicillium olsonii]|nr:unnamed protein product [Penicillium olsonii]
MAAGCFLQRGHQPSNLPAKVTLIYQRSRLPSYLSRRQHIFQHCKSHQADHGASQLPTNEINTCSSLEQSDTSRWSKKEQPTTWVLGAIQALAQIRPDHPAICTSTETLSYAELDHITTKWASYLQA